MSQEGPSLRSEEYSCRTAHQILGPQGETSREEDIVPVCDMQVSGRVQHIPNQGRRVYQNLG